MTWVSILRQLITTFHSKSCICAYSDTLATVTLLPGPKGVTVGRDICSVKHPHFPHYRHLKKTWKNDQCLLQKDIINAGINSQLEFQFWVQGYIFRFRSLKNVSDRGIYYASWFYKAISSNPYEGHNNQLVPWWKLRCGQPIDVKNLASLWTSGNEYSIRLFNDYALNVFNWLTFNKVGDITYSFFSVTALRKESA